MKALSRSHLLVSTLLLLGTIPAFADQAERVDESLPRVLYPVRPTQPEVLGFFQKGVVIVSCTITAKGDVINAKVYRSTNEALNDAAIAAIKGWKFTPAFKNGHPVSCKVLQPLDFN